MASAPEDSTASQNIYAQVDDYPWDSDREFQGGLSAILGANPSADQAVELALRARCFYYSRKFNIPVDFDAYKAYRASTPSPSRVAAVSTNGLETPTTSSTSASPQPRPQPQSQPAAPSSASPASSQSQAAPSSSASAAPASSNSPDDAPYPTSFARIVELITTGQPIPGIKEIPDTVLEGQGTVPAASRRRKPWERGVDTAAATSSAAGSGLDTESRAEATEAEGA